MQKSFCLSVGRAWRPFMGRSDHQPEIQEKKWRTWEPRTECQRLWSNSSARRLCRWHDCRVWLAKREGAGKSVLSNWGEAVCEIFQCAFRHPCYDRLIFRFWKYIQLFPVARLSMTKSFSIILRTFLQMVLSEMLCEQFNNSIHTEWDSILSISYFPGAQRRSDNNGC